MRSVKLSGADFRNAAHGSRRGAALQQLVVTIFV
jgi:hypothetical protein